MPNSNGGIIALLAEFGLVALLIGYLFGSIPFGLLLTKLAGFGDIRAIGSGNIGATNVLRTGKKGLAALTLLLDVGKGAAAVLAVSCFIIPWLASRSGDPANPQDLVIASCLAGFGAVLGHVFPAWLRFKGGKGVATALGVFTALSWPVGVGCIVTWLLVAAVSRFSSLAALVAMALAPFYAYLWSEPAVVVLTAVVALLVIAKHHENIRRLLKGEEPRIGRPA
jgi:glycerol-3-phosphate acyltransferase PlsY